MILRAKDGVRGELWDLDTGKRIPKIRWFNDETGEFEAYAVDGNGDYILLPDKSRKVYIGRGRLKFVGHVPPKPVLVGPPQPKPTPTKPRQRYERIDLPLFSDWCEAYGCNRVAAWMVSDEVPLPPLVKGGRRFGRAKVVDTHYYCSWHFKPPRILDTRGEVVEELHDVKVRPE